MTELRIITAGSRDFNNYDLLKTTVENIIIYEIEPGGISNIKIISGTARGADRLGEQFAKQFHYDVVRFPANWDRFGKSAGYIRNEEMAKYAVEDGNRGVLVAFWDGESRGTKHMIDLANKHGLEVHVVKYKEK